QNLPDVDTKGFIELLKKQGSNFATDFNKRNIVHALRNEKGEIERVLLRSDNKQLEVKEKQIKLTEEATSLFKHKLENETIVIAESQLDGLSLIKENSNLGLIGLTGVNRTKELYRFLEENYKDMLNKQFIVAMDNDKAGIQATNEITLKLEELGLIAVNYSYNSDMKDLNDLLNNEPEKLREGLNGALNGLKTIRLSDKDMEVRNMCKYVSQVISNVSTNPDSLTKLMDNVLENPNLSIDNHALLMSQGIDSKNISSEYMLRKEGIIPKEDIEKTKGLYCFTQRGYFKGDKYIPLKQGEYINDTKIYVKSKWYIKENLYQNNDVGLERELDDTIYLNVDDQLKVLNDYAKNSNIKIQVSNMRNDVYINNSNLSITLNKGLSKEMMVDYLIDNISTIKAKQYFINKNVATVCSKQLSNVLSKKIKGNPISTNTKSNNRILATEVKYISRFLKNQNGELNKLTARQLNKNINRTQESGYDR
ncbi:MAG: toprim domain-containing protein, partial [Bacilli bacterium]